MKKLFPSPANDPFTVRVARVAAVCAVIGVTIADVISRVATTMELEPQSGFWWSTIFALLSAVGYIIVATKADGAGSSSGA
jgi:uncharacterized membrane protein HdeD (DUF308 family)